MAPAAPVRRGLPGSGAPVIAWGPAALMRARVSRRVRRFPAGIRGRPRSWSCGRSPRSPARSKRYRFPWGEVSFEGKDLRTPGGPVPHAARVAHPAGAPAQSRGGPVPRAALAYSIADAAPRAASRAVDVHVVALRKKVRGAVPAAGRFIQCVRGQGYMVP